jgi:hypothetical protein
MKTQLQKELAQIAPSIAIETIWEHIDGHLEQQAKEAANLTAAFTF